MYRIVKYSCIHFFSTLVIVLGLFRSLLVVYNLNYKSLQLGLFTSNERDLSNTQFQQAKKCNRK